MTILLTGGAGKTSIRTARLLYTAGIPSLLASRTGSAPEPFKACSFDWLDETTYSTPFEEAGDIKAIYLVAPTVVDQLKSMKPFIEFSRRHGVERFVLMSASSLECGGPMMGKVHEYLVSLGVDYCVLRPSWFMENLSELQHLAPLRDERKIYSATRQGKIPWVSADDIAAVAFRALVDKKSYNTEHLILGPELLSYNEVAETIGKVVGCGIAHVQLSESELVALMQSKGLPEHFAKMLASMDSMIARGHEERLSNTILRVVGRPPVTLAAFAEANKACWR